MSWLRPENVPPSDYDPQKVVDAMVEKHGWLSRKILDTFNHCDPLHVFYGVNVDEYHGYVERFIEQLGKRDFITLPDQDIKDLVRGSFHQSQIDQGFADPKDIEELALGIIKLRDNSAQ